MIFPYTSMKQFVGYEQKWVALRPLDKSIVGSGDTLQQAADEASQQGYKDPIFFKVPPAGYFVSTPFAKNR